MSQIIEISIESKKGEVAKFFSTKFNIKKNDIIIKNLIKEYISGDILLDLEKYNEFTSLGIEKPVKEKLKKYLEDNKERFIRKPIELTVDFNSKNEEVKNFLKNYLSFDVDKYNIDNFDGKKMFKLSYEDMKINGLKIGQRIKLSNYIIYAIKEILKKNILDKTKEKSLKSLLSCKEIEILQLGAEIYEECNILYKKLNTLCGYQIKPISPISKYNVFFILSISEKIIDNSNLLIYLDNNGFLNNVMNYLAIKKKKYLVFKHILIYDKKITKNDEDIRYIIVQVPIIKDLNQLTIYVGISKRGKLYKYESTIYIEPNKENYFYINHLYFDKDYYMHFPIFSENEIYSCYLDFYFNLKSNHNYQIENIKKNLIEYLINNISYNRQINLNAENILRLFKICLDLNIKPYNINSLIIINEDIKLNKNYYLSNEDINSPIFSNVKQSIINLIVIIYVNYDKEFLIKLILSKDSKEVCRTVLDLLNNNKLKYSIFAYNNQEDLVHIQNNLISISKTKNEIENILKISKGLTNYLEVIKDNYDYFLN